MENSRTFKGSIFAAPRSMCRRRTDRRFTGARIAIVEDDEALREAIALYLREKGCFVENFACVEDASSAGGLELYDAVISDYLLPGEDGLSFLRRVRETSKNVFTILITAFAAWDLSEDAMLAGVDIFIPKPFSALELDSALQRMAERRESEDGDLPLVNG